VRVQDKVGSEYHPGSDLVTIPTLRFTVMSSPASEAQSPTSGNITVLYFAASSTATGLTSETIPIPIIPFKLTNLRDHLTSIHSQAKDLKKILDGSLWSVNEEMIVDEDEVVLRGGEIVGVIPPVSGG
jgi:molybdopterin converting factor small subunit